MQATDTLTLKTLYTEWYCTLVQKYTAARVPIMTQTQMAHRAGVSLRTIQRFENYDTDSAYLLWLYRHVLLVK